jgi:hypothetical protein
LRHTRAILFRAENNIKPDAACPGILAYEQLDGVDARMSRDYCVFFAYNTGSSYVMKTFPAKRTNNFLKMDFNGSIALAHLKYFRLCAKSRLMKKLEIICPQSTHQP